MAGADPVRAGTVPDAWAAALAGSAGSTAHWRLEVTGAPGLEVLDTAAGLWTLAPADPALLALEGETFDGVPVAIRPTTPSAIWRRLAPLAA